MSLLGFQSALARLYLDPGARAEVRAGRWGSLADCDLSEAELRDLRGLLEEQSERVESLSRTLRRKRIEKLEAFYPLVSRCLGSSSWGSLLDGYLDAHPVPDPSSPAADAAGLAAHLHRTLDRRDGDEGAISDLLTLEGGKAEIATETERPPEVARPVLDAEASRPRLVAPARVHELGRPPGALREWVEGGAERPVPVAPAPTWVLLYRRPGTTSVVVAEIGAGLARMLGKANGVRTVAELAEELAEGGGRAAGVADLWRALEPLRRAGVVDFPDES